jgi:hypothetical protein
LLAEKQSGLTKKLDELQSSIEKANKEREALKEAGKQLQKNALNSSKKCSAERKNFKKN